MAYPHSMQFKPIPQHKQKTQIMMGVVVARKMGRTLPEVVDCFHHNFILGKLKVLVVVPSQVENREQHPVVTFAQKPVYNQMFYTHWCESGVWPFANFSVAAVMKFVFPTKFFVQIYVARFWRVLIQIEVLVF